ncbi:MAG TPA: hypothetical protein VFB78_16540 [Acidimicrobiales bacterium]|nr:hypothetical protein [Acidimicrobiales bacterium]
MATRVRRVVDSEDVVDDAEVVNRSVARAPWSPAQFVALIVGVILVIIGGIALAKTGLNFNGGVAHHRDVAGFDQTSLLGLIEFVIGLFLIGAGAVPGGARGAMTFFGVLLFGFGIVLMIANDTSTSLQRWVSADDGAGWFFAIVGVVLLATAMLSPVIFGNDRRSVARRVEVFER